MKPEIEKMHKVWEGLVTENRNPTEFPKVKFDEILSSIFSLGQSYTYVIDFFDMGISNISPGFTKAHGVAPEKIKNINDVLVLMHPDDMDFVAKAEEKAFNFLYTKIGVEKTTSYKISYNLRVKTAEGKYELFNHQSLILTMDENYNFIKSLNIHTNIHHLTKTNNNKISLIGLGEEPSYLNIDVFEDSVGSVEKQELSNLFTKREIEIIKLIAEGLKTKEISEKLFIAKDTVDTHRKNILSKASCKNAAELIARSMSEGWI